MRAKEKPSIFDYTDYRLFLRDQYLYRKARDKKFSHRFIALHVGAGSSGWFSDLINKRINLTRIYLINICKILNMSPRESDFFELLVSYSQSGSLEEKNKYFHKLLTFKDVNGTLISRDQFEYFNRWYITAIRELLLFYDFKDDYRDLGRMLDPVIRPQEAKLAIDMLLSLGFIQCNDQGFLKPVVQTIVKDTAFKSVCWGNFVTSMMKLAIESIDRHDISMRDISAVSIGLSAESLQAARAEISGLRKKLLALSEQDINKNIVYQCNIQLFPLTQQRKS